MTPELIPVDFFLRDNLKSNVYASKPYHIEELHANIK